MHKIDCDIQALHNEKFVPILEVLFYKGVAIDPTLIKIVRLERTEPKLIHFKLGGRVKDTPISKFTSKLMEYLQGNYSRSRWPKFMKITGCLVRTKT